MAETEEVIKSTAEGLKYLLRKRKTKTQEMEEAVEGPPETPPVPQPPPEKELVNKSTGGSPAFSGEEMKKGYRKL